jgi:hypothetical protein
MHPSTKLLGWIAATALVVPTIQLPGISQELNFHYQEIGSAKQAGKSENVLLKAEGVLEAASLSEEGDRLMKLGR